MTDRPIIGHGSTLNPAGATPLPVSIKNYSKTAARPTLIALSSPAMGSGKSTVADRLIHQHGFVLLKFAGPLKYMTRTLLEQIGMDAEEIERRVEGDLKEEIVPALQATTRKVMQALGTEFGRLCLHENVWADATKARAQYYLDRGISVVIDDMRYRNELEAVRSILGIPVRVTRPGAAVTSTHSSEGELDDEPMTTIQNTGSIQDLHRQVDAMLAHLLDTQ
jgi:hypothetical protein